MRVRPSDLLTNPDVKIGICHDCSRYGQIGRASKVCRNPDPWVVFHGMPVPKEFWARIEYCQRVKRKKGMG